jgi:hypothetical protein
MHPIGAGVATVSAAHVTASAARPIVGWILIGIGLATSLGEVAYRTGEVYHKLINSTEAILDLAIEEVLQWQCSPHHEDNSTEAVSKEKKLELLGKYENLTQF